MVTEGRVVRRDRLGVWIDMHALLYVRCQPGPTVKKNLKKIQRCEADGRVASVSPKLLKPLRGRRRIHCHTACSLATLWILGETWDLCVQSPLEHRTEPAPEDPHG